MTVTMSYGVLYYAFTVLAPAIVSDTGWSATAVTAAFSGGSVLGAVGGIAVGRLLQRCGPRPVMTTGSLLGAGAIAAVALAPSYPVFVVAWLVVGAAGAGTSYPPAFAALTQWYGGRRVRAITTLTLVAGFASTVFAPLTALLGEGLGWRGAYLALGGAYLVLTVPVHLLALGLPWRPAVHRQHGPPDRQVVTSRPFVMLTAAGALASLVSYASLVHLVPLLIDRGMDVQLAAWALGLGGAGQVAGRLLYPALDRRLPPNPRAVLVLTAMALAMVALAVVPGPAALLVAVAVLSGAARGLFTLVSASVVADHWGSDRYAALNGAYSAPLGVAAALAPAFGAAVAAAAGGPTALFAVLGVLALVAAALAASAGSPDSHLSQGAGVADGSRRR
ncbi:MULTISPECIES: MFS transporter [unclassified Modestobacter]